MRNTIVHATMHAEETMCETQPHMQHAKAEVGICKTRAATMLPSMRKTAAPQPNC